MLVKIQLRAIIAGAILARRRHGDLEMKKNDTKLKQKLKLNLEPRMHALVALHG